MNKLGPAVYMVSALTGAACSFLLLRGYRVGRQKLLLWSGICFSVLAFSNVLLFIDLVLLPAVDLYRWRLVTAAIAMAFMLYGLVWESK